MGRVDRATFVADLDRCSTWPAGIFDSIWVSDHLMEGDRYRIEPWTQLTWLAARVPGVRLGHNVLANSYRHPALMAKMAASLQALSGGRFILGYGAGWLEDEYRAYGYPFPSDPRSDRADGRGPPADQDDVDRVAGHVRRASATRSATRTASRGPTRPRPS